MTFEVHQMVDLLFLFPKTTIPMISNLKSWRGNINDSKSTGIFATKINKKVLKEFTSAKEINPINSHRLPSMRSRESSDNKYENMEYWMQNQIQLLLWTAFCIGLFIYNFPPIFFQIFCLGFQILRRAFFLLSGIFLRKVIKIWKILHMFTFINWSKIIFLACNNISTTI